MKRPLATICLSIILILAISTQFFPPVYPDYSAYSDQTVDFSGIVDKITYKNKNGELKMLIYLKHVTSPSDVTGVVCYMKSAEHCPHIGSNVTISGTAFVFDSPTNPGQFDSPTYYYILGIGLGTYSAEIISESQEYSFFKDRLFRIRRNISAKLTAYLPETEASIMKTMLLGESTEIDQDIKDLYQRNGIAHILSISGLHISLIGVGLYKLLRKILSLRTSAVLSCIFMILYGIMTGFSVSSLRAIIMFSISMTSVIIGRTYDLITALSLCASLILLENPMYIYHSGFAFSFGCVAGIAYIMPYLLPASKLQFPKFLIPIMEGLCMTIIGLPLYFWYYNQLPIYAILLNLFVIPIMTILVSAGILLILCLYTYPPVGDLLKYLIVGILQFFEKSALFSDTLPGHFYTPGRPSLWQIALYLAALVLILSQNNHCNLVTRWLVMTLLSGLLILRIFPDISITMLDIGQGDCSLITISPQKVVFPGFTPQYNMLIDSGSSTIKEIGKYRLIPCLKYKGISKLDAVVITHTDSDHMNGIFELIELGHSNGIRIEHIYLPDANDSLKNDNYFKLMTLASRAQIPVTFINRGDLIYKDKSTQIQCLSPFSNNIAHDINELSTVIYLKADSFSALFTGDLQNNSENELVDYMSRTNIAKNVTFLKCGHHGSDSSTSKYFLDITSPRITAISCGINNSYGHPHKKTLERLAQANSTVYRTDIDGAIELHIDNNRLKIKLYGNNAHKN